MSKKKKVSAKPAAKKKAAKPAGKPSKKVTKVSAKKPLKKASKVPTATKKTVSKGNKKAVKPAPKKSAPVKKSAAKTKVVAQKVAKKVTHPVTSNKKAVPAKGHALKNNLKAVSKPSPKAAVKSPVNNNKNSHPPKNNKALAPTSGNKPALAKVVKTLPAIETKIAGKELRAQTASPVSLKTAKPEESKKVNSGAAKSNEVLAITNTIPVTKKSEISASKIASISRSITNPVRKTDSYAVKAEKEPAGKFEMEFVLHSSSEMLYEFLSTASGLSEWFCDDLNIRNGIYTFIWDDQLQQARLLKTIELQIVRFQWVDKTDGSYFEFKIQKDDLTNDIALIITDFADTNSERESAKLLWQSQIEKLRHVIGSIF